MTDINYPSRALSSATDSVTIAGTIVATNPSVSPTGAAVPASGTYVAVDVGGNLTGLTGTANGLKVDGSAVTQPVSGSVTVTQATAANLNATVSQATAANLNATVTGTVAATQSGTWNVNNVSGTVSLPTGASTSAKQPALGTAGTASADVITVQGIAGATAVKVDGSASTQPVSGTVTANAGTGSFTVAQATASNLNAAVVGTGTAGTPAGGVLTVQGSASGTSLNVSNAGRATAWLLTNDYAALSINTSTYRSIINPTPAKCSLVYISDTSGSSLIIAVGSPGSQVDVLYVGPGGNDAPFELTIAQSSSVWVKALDVNANTGRLVITALQ